PYRAKTLPTSRAEEVAADNDKFRLELGSGAQVDVEGRQRLYRRAVRAADEQLQAIASTIERHGSGRESLIVVTADHGESFGDHGAVGHGRSLYGPAHHVPLLLIGKGFTPGLTLDASVSNGQLAATLYDWAGIEASDRSLLRDVGPGAAPRTVAVWFPRGSMVQSGTWRLIWTEFPYLLDRPESWAHREQYELFDLSRDPGERTNLFAARPPELGPLLDALESHWLIPRASQERAIKQRP
ncbi:MAG: hypothetical protein EXR76_02570, partial [Myxococcales bacterium]|nr:hypothetical protein [Myxococcales bacterium]